MSFSRVVRRPRSTSTVSPGDVAANDRIRPPGPRGGERLVEGRRPGAATRAQSAPRPSVMRPHLAPPRRPPRRAPRPAPSERASASRSASVSETTTSPAARARDLHQQQADRPLADDEHRLALRDPRLAHRLQAGVHRLDEGGLLGEDAVRDRDRAARDDPVDARARTRRSRRPRARSRPSCRSSCRAGTGRRAGARSRSSRRTARGGGRPRARPRGTRASARPSAATVPAISCPKMRGPGSRPFSIFLRSVGQIPQASTRTSISPGPGSGTGTSSTRRSPLPR